MRKLTTIACAGAFALFTGAARSQDSGALLDLLVRKQVINDQEAEEVRSELVKEAAATSAGKINLSSSLTELKLGGDLRMRYQYDNKDPQVFTADKGDTNIGTPNGTQRSRYRFRLRLNADFKLGSQFFGGVQLVTSSAADSDNQTFGSSGDGAGFSDYNIYISRAFMGWNVNDWATLVLGKQPNPFYSTDLVWDTDVNPQGLVEIISLDKLFAETSGGIREQSPLQLTLNMGQFLYQDNAESEFDADAGTDAYMFVGQLAGTYKFSSSVSATLAPGFMFFNAADLSGFNNENSFSGAKGVSGETRKLTILTAPGDVSFKLGNLPTKFYWDFAYNTDAKGRAEDIYGLYASDGSSNYSDQDAMAYLFGIQFGGGKKQGDWTAFINYRQTGIASIDPNLNDSDFALGELNTRGFKGGVAYNFTDFLAAGVTYMHGWNLRDDLAGGQATSDTRIAEANAVDVLQIDVNLKF